MHPKEKKSKGKKICILIKKKWSRIGGGKGLKRLRGASNGPLRTDVQGAYKSEGRKRGEGRRGTLFRCMARVRALAGDALGAYEDSLLGYTREEQAGTGQLGLGMTFREEAKDSNRQKKDSNKL